MSEKGLEKLQIDPIYEELKINTKNVNNEKLQEKLLSIFKNCTIRLLKVKSTPSSNYNQL